MVHRIAPRGHSALALRGFLCLQYRPRGYANDGGRGFQIAGPCDDMTGCRGMGGDRGQGAIQYPSSSRKQTADHTHVHSPGSATNRKVC